MQRIIIIVCAVFFSSPALAATSRECELDDSKIVAWIWVESGAIDVYGYPGAVEPRSEILFFDRYDLPPLQETSYSDGSFHSRKPFSGFNSVSELTIIVIGDSCLGKITKILPWPLPGY